MEITLYSTCYRLEIATVCLESPVCSAGEVWRMADVFIVSRQFLPLLYWQEIKEVKSEPTVFKWGLYKSWRPWSLSIHNTFYFLVVGTSGAAPHLPTRYTPDKRSPLAIQNYRLVRVGVSLGKHRDRHTDFLTITHLFLIVWRYYSINIHNMHILIGSIWK